MHLNELGHTIYESADSAHFHFYRIAVLHARDARGRPRRNQVARIQCHDLRDVPYKKGDRKRHVSRVAFLFYFTVETGLDGNTARIDFSFNPRTDGTECVKRFAAG